MKKIQWKALIISLVISLGVGGLSALLTKDSMDIYEKIIQPPLSPPSIVFPIVWTALFVLMGISAYLVYINHNKNSRNALYVYAAQLFVNFFWTIIFFNMQMYLFAFIWLILLWVLVIFMIIKFFGVSRLAAYLQIPYLVWLTFAAYLNLAIWLLNK